MFCKKCGAQVEDDARFCNKCGALTYFGEEVAAREGQVGAEILPPEAAVTEVMGTGAPATPVQSGAATPGASPAPGAASTYVPVASAPSPLEKKGRGPILALIVVLVIALAAAGTFFFLSRDAGALSIDESTFPDGTFRAYVMDNCDTDGDGKLSKDEIEAVRVIDLSQMSAAGYGPVRDLTGIDVFKNLEQLNAQNNDLTGEVDLSRNENLKDVDTSGNPNATQVDVPVQTNNVVTDPGTEVVHTPPLPAPEPEPAPQEEQPSQGSNGDSSDSDEVSIEPAEDVEPWYISGIEDADALFSSNANAIPAALEGAGYYLEDTYWNATCLDIPKSIWTDGNGTYIWFSSLATPLGTWHESVDGLHAGVAPAMMHIRVAGGSTGSSGTVVELNGLESYAVGLDLGGAASMYATETADSGGHIDDEVSVACGITPDGNAWFAYSLYEHDAPETIHEVNLETDGGVEIVIMSASDFKSTFGVSAGNEGAAEAVFEAVIANRTGDLVGEYYDPVDLMDLTGKQQVRALEALGYEEFGGTWSNEKSFESSGTYYVTTLGYAFYDANGREISAAALEDGEQAVIVNRTITPQYEGQITNGPALWLYDPTLEGKDPFSIGSTYEGPVVTVGSISDGYYAGADLMTIGGEDGVWWVAEYSYDGSDGVYVDHYEVYYALADAIGIVDTEDLYPLLSTDS